MVYSWFVGVRGGMGILVGYIGGMVGGAFEGGILGVCVGGPSCASSLVCVWGVLLVPQTWCVCGGPFLCLKLGVRVGGPLCGLQLGYCVGAPPFVPTSLLVPSVIHLCRRLRFTTCIHE